MQVERGPEVILGLTVGSRQLGHFRPSAVGISLKQVDRPGIRRRTIVPSISPDRRKVAVQGNAGAEEVACSSIGCEPLGGLRPGAVGVLLEQINGPGARRVQPVRAWSPHQDAIAVKG